MTIADIEQFFETWAPSWTAWERDAIGLQVGDRERRIRRVLVALDVTREIVGEAIAKKADLIVSHHPLLFHPPSSITTGDETGRLVLMLAEKRIGVYSAHTNLDFTRGGVSFALAEALGLHEIEFLSPLKDTLAKIAVFVPSGYVDAVAEAMRKGGAGAIGHYDSCSFRIAGTGTFRGSASSNPFLGEKGKLETVDETRIEMIAPSANIPSIITNMKAVHPYEAVAYDVYPLQNGNPDHGMGAIGNLAKPMDLRSFLKGIRVALDAEAVRYTGRLNRRVQRIAVCGGSGSDLLPNALTAHADAFITADVKYHTFHSAGDRIVLIDAGHWETEHVILKPIAQRLKQYSRTSGESLEVFTTNLRTNPTHFLSS
ncbi:MAG: Nif3-like dinuclear metal center hexameric protein [Bacteroidota bacterium]